MKNIRNALLATMIMVTFVGIRQANSSDTNLEQETHSNYITNGLAELPNNTFIKVTQIIYAKNKPWSLMGDGFSAVIASVTKEELTSYLKDRATPDKHWRRGPIIKQEKELINFLKEWMRVEKVDQPILDKVDIESLFRSSDAYFWSEKRFSSSGFVSDGQLWIIDPKKNMIIMLNENT